MKTILHFARQKVHLQNKKAVNILSKFSYGQQSPFLLMLYRRHKTSLTSINWSPREKTSASKCQVPNIFEHLLCYFYFYKLRMKLLSLSQVQTQWLNPRCQLTKQPIAGPTSQARARHAPDPCTYLAKTAPAPGSSITDRFSTPLFSHFKNIKPYHK